MRIAESREQLLIREHNDRMTAAWLTAAMGRGKKLPKLEKLLLKQRTRPKPRQSMKQQIAIARMWTALGYGRMGTIKPRD